MEGKIKWYKREKGYGFIVGDDGKDYFVHYSSLPQDQEDVSDRDEIKVTFELKEQDDGRVQATDIKFVGKEDSGSNDAAPEDEEA